MTFAPGDAHDFCIYKGRFRFSFPILDADGDPVTGATGLDSERSIDFATGADCTNEATEFTTAPVGMYWLDLTSAETTGSNVSGVTKTTSSGAKSTTWSIPIVRLPILESGTAAAGAAGTITLASAASAKDGFYSGLYIQCSNDTPSNVLGQTRKIISYVGSTKVATVESSWGTNPTSSTTYDVLIPLTANVGSILAQRMPDWVTAGVPAVDVANWKGTAVATPGTAGTPSVDITRINNVAAGTTTAQLGVNVINVNGTTQTARDLGLALPAAAPGATGGVFIAGTNAATTITTGLTTTFTGNLTGSVGSVTGAVGSVTGAVGSVTGAVGSVTGNVEGNVVGTVGAAASVTGNVGGNVVGSVGSVTGAVGSVTAVVSSNLTQILGTALTETAGQIAAAFKKFFNVATPTGTVDSIPDAVPGAAGGLFIAGTNAATTVTTGLTTTFTGNLTGSVGSVTGAVGSVTGAVGSVTGNVGGNVTGTVGTVNAIATDAINSSALATTAVTEIVNAIVAVAGADPSGVPTANAAWPAKIDWICAKLRNKETMNRTTGVVNLRNDGDTTTIGTFTASDDGTTFTRPKAT